MKDLLYWTILISFLLFGTPSWSQFNYKSGFVVTLENDTLFGRIRDGSVSYNSKYCKFKNEVGGEVLKYRPESLKEYRFIDSKYYVAGDVFYKGKFRNVFYEVLLGGTVNLYYYHLDKSQSYYIGRRDSTLIGLRNLEMNYKAKSDYGRLVYDVHSEIYIPLFRDSLFYFFSDCPEILPKLNKLRYKRAEIMGITHEYVQKTCKEDNCIEYTKDLNASKTRFGFYTGYQIHQKKDIVFGEEINDTIVYTIPIGLVWNLPLSFISEQLSCQLELMGMYANNSFGLDIPASLHYEFKGKRISPFLGAGKALFLAKWFVDFGADYSLGKKMSIYSSLRFQTKTIPERFPESVSKHEIGAIINTASWNIGLKF